MNRPREEQTWRLTIAYDGKDFCGYQAQPGQRSVQEELQKAVRVLAGEDVFLRVAGRTDAGVHALGQTLGATFSSTVPEEKMALALSSQLPRDISVIRAEHRSPDFDAKQHAIGKKYIYRILNRTPRDPFREKTTWHVRGGFDLEAAQQAAVHLIGEHDFESFRSAQCDADHARRYIWKCDLQRDDDEIRVDVRGNAFCRNMVRIIVGTLVDVGRGRFTADDVARILAEKRRESAGVTAPAHGLFLDTVFYKDGLAEAGIPEGARFPRFPPD